MRILVDTNIIIDALTGREPWNQEAEQIFLMAANQIADMYITASSATDIFYILRKHLHNTEESKQVMGKLYDLFGILNVTGKDCIDALASTIKDYEDAVLENVAKTNNIDYIVTRNIKDYEMGNVTVLLPKDLIEALEKE